MASSRVLRVAELIHAEPTEVRDAAALLPRGVTAAFAELSAGTLLTLETRLPWWDRRPRRLVLRELHLALAHVVNETHRVTIVAAVLIHDARVLVAQRDHPPEMSGKWEFPGGKVEAGESPRAALRRECAEELGTSVDVGVELGRQRLDTGATLIFFDTRLSHGAPSPSALEHRQLRWVARDQLDGIDWLATNRRFVTDVTGWL
jgi:8-oxo-dGTP diphosphatase